VRWGAAYALLLAVLLVRVRSAETVPIEPAQATPEEPLWLVTAHHALFYAVLAGAPIEAVVAGGVEAGRAAGATLFALGVLGYRLAGHALGAALSPFIAPRDGATLVTRGPYRCLRHPMYLAQAAIAVGAPLTLGCRAILVLVPLALLVLAVRMKLEDAALARAFPEHSDYAARTKRIVPFVF